MRARGEGLLAGWILRRDRSLGRTLLAWVGGGLVMVAGYFIFQVSLYGLGAALVELPFNVVQMAVGGVVGVPISLALRTRIRV